MFQRIRRAGQGYIRAKEAETLHYASGAMERLYGREAGRESPRPTPGDYVSPQNLGQAAAQEAKYAGQRKATQQFAKGVAMAEGMIQNVKAFSQPIEKTGKEPKADKSKQKPVPRRRQTRGR